MAKWIASERALIARGHQGNFAVAISAGLAHQGRGEFEQARAAFERAINDAPQDPRGYAYRAELALASAHPERAVPDFTRAIALARASRTPEIRIAHLQIKLADVFARLSELDTARKVLNEVLELPGFPETLRAEARLNLDLLLLSAADPIDALVDLEANKAYRSAEELRAERPLEVDFTIEGLWRPMVLSRPDRSERILAEMSFALRDGRLSEASSMADALSQETLQLSPADLASARAVAGLAEIQSDSLSALVDLKELVAASPESLLARAALARAHLQGGDRARGLELAREARALSTRGNDEIGRVYREGARVADLALRSRSPQLYLEARRRLIRAQHLYPLHAESLLLRSRLYAAFNAPRAALVAAVAAIETDPGFPEAQEWLGYLHLKTRLPERLRSLDSAQAAFERAIEATLQGEVGGQRFGPAHAWFGRSLVRAEQAALSPRWGRVVLRDGRVFEEVAFLARERGLLLELPLGSLLFARDQIAEARPAPNESAHSRRPALLLLQLEDLLLACSATPDRYPSASPLQVSRALRYQESLSDYYRANGPAADAALAAKRASATATAARAAALGLLKRARQSTQKRSTAGYTKAIDLLDSAIQLDPTCAPAFQLRSQTYLKLGSFLAGILDLSLALEQDPALGAEALSNLFQISDLIDFERAISELDRLVVANPKSQVFLVRGLFYLAKAQARRWQPADFKRGQADFTRCIELTPKHTLPYLFRSLIRELALEQLGRSTPKEIRADLDHVLRLDPKSVPARLGLARELVRLGKLEGAFDELQEARNLHGDYLDPALLQGFNYGPLRFQDRVRSLTGPPAPRR